MGTRNGRLASGNQTPQKLAILLLGQPESGKTCWYKSCKRFLGGNEHEFDPSVLYKQVGDDFGRAVVTSARCLLQLVHSHEVSFTATSDGETDWSLLEKATDSTEFSPSLATACASLWADEGAQRVLHSPKRLEHYLPVATEELLDNALVHFGNEYARANLDPTCVYRPTSKPEEHVLLLPGLDLTIVDTCGTELNKIHHKWAKPCPEQDLVVFFVSLCGYAQKAPHSPSNQLMQSLESFNQLMLVLNMDPKHVAECPSQQLFEQTGLEKPQARESATPVHIVFTMSDLLDSFLSDVPLQAVLREFGHANTTVLASKYIKSLFTAIYQFHRGADAQLTSHCINARSSEDSIAVLEAVCGSKGLVVAEEVSTGCCK